MAKIEMDVSEWEAMKKVELLLEQSLKKEQDLNSEIIKLKEEKIEALESAKMKVVKINKTEVIEYLRPIKDSSTIYREISRAFNVPLHERYPTYTDIAWLVDRCYDTIKTTSFPEESITTHGLDEIKLEIQKDLESKLSKDIKLKLEKAKEALSYNTELVKENGKLQKENKFLNDLHMGMSKNMENLENENNEFKETLKNQENDHLAILSIKEVLTKYNIFNAFSIIKSIKNLINKTK